MLVLERVNDKWWWVELEGRVGYAPANYLNPIDEQEDKWQNEEYFSSYSSLVRHEDRESISFTIFFFTVTAMFTKIMPPLEILLITFKHSTLSNNACT